MRDKRGHSANCLRGRWTGGGDRQGHTPIGVSHVPVLAMPRPRDGMTSLGEVIADIVDQVRRIRPSSARNPHAFHEDKSEVIGALNDLAELVRAQR